MIITRTILTLRQPVPDVLLSRVGILPDQVELTMVEDPKSYLKQFLAMCSETGAEVRIVPIFVVHHDHPHTQGLRGPYLVESKIAGPGFFDASGGWPSLDLDIEKMSLGAPSARQAQDHSSSTKGNLKVGWAGLVRRVNSRRPGLTPQHSHLSTGYFVEYWSRLLSAIDALEVPRSGSLISLDPRSQWDPNDGTDPAAGANSLEGFLIALSALISKQDKQRTAQRP